MATPDGWIFLSHGGLYRSSTGNASTANYMTSTSSPAYYDNSATSAYVDAYQRQWNEWVRVQRDEQMLRTSVTWRTWIDNGTNATAHYERRLLLNDELLAAQSPEHLEWEVNRMIADNRQIIRQQIDTPFQQQMQQQAMLRQQEYESRRISERLEQEVFARGIWDEAAEFDPLNHVPPVDSYSKMQENRRKAEKKAQKLLGELIGEKELAVYDETKRLFVRGEKFDYIVPAEGFVKAIGKDKVIDLCIHLRDKDKMPKTDNVIALKMMIEADEGNVLKMANKHGEYGMDRVNGLRAACAGGM